jgi:hypothetical protein
MTISITSRQQEILASILSGSLNMYGWDAAKSIYQNRVTIGKATESERQMTPYDTLMKKGLITLHTSEQGNDSKSSAYSHAALTERAIELAEKAFNKIYLGTFKEALGVAEEKRKIPPVTSPIITEKTLTFTVKIKYESTDGDLLNLCPVSAAQNLEAAIDNERMNGALTPDDISASAAVVSMN